MKSSQGDIGKELVQFLPKMRGWALRITRNSAEADDLVQETATKVLAGSQRFIPGTNFSAWVRRIMLNEFINEVRRRRKLSSSDELPERAEAPKHEDRMALAEFSRILPRLPADQREAMELVVLGERSYEEVLILTGCAVGTIKSRVHRARTSLRRHFRLEDSPTADDSVPD